MQKVAAIMSPRVVAVRSDCDLGRAIDTFLRTAVRHLVVLDPDGRVLGVLSAQQVIGALDGPEPCTSRPVGDQVVTVSARVRPGDDVRRAVEVMLGELVDAVAVVGDDDRVVGVLAWSDVVAHITRLAS
jgi:predicted transcriptional regulator